MELLAPLGLNFKLLFIQIVGFVLLYWLLKRFLFGRVMEMIKKRGDEIRNAYEENEKTRSDVQLLKSDYESKLLQARAKAEQIIQEATNQAEKNAQEIIEKTRTEAALIKQKGLAEIELEKKRVISELRNDVINLSLAIATRLIEKSLDKKAAERYADEVINQIGSMRQ